MKSEKSTITTFKTQGYPSNLFKFVSDMPHVKTKTPPTAVKINTCIRPYSPITRMILKQFNK